MATDSFFRTWYYHSGGSVATLALDSLADGRLENSGNVHAHKRFVPEKPIADRVKVWTETSRPVVGPPPTPAAQEKPKGANRSAGGREHPPRAARRASAGLRPLRAG
jgi:hypothetical protein